MICALLDLCYKLRFEQTLRHRVFSPWKHSYLVKICNVEFKKYYISQKSRQ